ncbi:MAG: hypothetical protein L0332_12500 [Chloroflexi bacterium]|nr:hypothetical protein [Chloroflexota bacterium]
MHDVTPCESRFVPVYMDRTQINYFKHTLPHAPPVDLLWQPGFEGTTWHNFYPREAPECCNLRSKAFIELPYAYSALTGSSRARCARITVGVPGWVACVMGSIPRQTLPDNLVQGRINQDPSVPGGQLGGSQNLGALDDVRLWQPDSLLDQMPTECLPVGIALWISKPVEIRLVLKHLPEVRIVIEAMQRELQLARQRPSKGRLASAACPCDKDMLIRTDLHLAFLMLFSPR